MAPSHVDLSVLWVPIMPETSKLGPAMEEAGKDATETFGKATSGIGDKIHDSFTKATGKVKDVFHKAGNDASESMAEGVKEQSSKVEDALEDTGKKAHSKFRDAVGDIGKEMVGAISPDVKQQLSARVEDVVGGAFKSAFGDEGIAGMVGGAVSKAAGQGFESWIDGVKDKVTGVKDTVNTTKKAFADLTGGETTRGIAGLSDSFGKLGTMAKQFGVDVGDLPKPIQDVVGETADWKTTTEGVAELFKGMPGVIGRIGTALEGLSGPLAVVAAGAETIWNGLPGIGGGLKQILEAPDPTKGFNSPIQGPAGIPTTGPVTLPPSLGGNANGVAPPGYTAAPGSLDPFAGLLPPGMAPPAGAATPPGALPSIAPPDMPDGTPPNPFVMPSGAPSSFRAPRDAGGASGLNLSTIPIAAQKYANDCIDASARIILSHSGINMTEDQMMGVIPAGGTIDSQAAGMNRLNPAGGFKAMPGSGGSPAAMFAAIKASIDSGTGSVLNVAPGSSLAGRNFSDGHFIAATGYNPDGTINLSDTAGGTKYSVSAVDAFQATRGRGIVAGTGAGPAGGAGPASPLGVGGSGGGGSLGSSGGVGIPTGAQHDPVYTMAADSSGSGGGAGGSDSQSQGQQLGSGLVNGVLQEFGLDGSMFKGFGGASNPLQFGITKLATGMANVFGGMFGGGQQGGGSLGGGGGSILPGLGSLIPHSAAGSVAIGPGGAQNVRTGETQNSTNHYYGNTGPTLNVTQNGQSPTQDLQETANGASNRMGAMGNTPNSGTLPATGTG